MTAFVGVIVKPSPLHGRGLFATEYVKQGSVILIWPIRDYHVILTEEQLFARLQDPGIRSSACRLFGKYFAYSSLGLADDEHVNHSVEPNMIYYFGFCIAKRAIAAGEELTIDYRLLNPAGLPKSDAFHVDGMSARDAFVQSSRMVLDLVLEDPSWEG